MFENELPLDIQSRKKLKLFNKNLHQCFRKVRVVNNVKKVNENEKRMHERVQLKKEVKLSTVSEKVKGKIEERILQIEAEIGNDISEKYHEEILNTLKKLGGDDGNLNGSGRNQLWKFLKSKYPKNTAAVPVGK